MILEVCKSLVSRLSSQDVEVCVQSAPANTQQSSLCSDDEMWWDQSDVSGQMSFDPNNNFNNVNVEALFNDSLLEDVKLFPSDVSDADDDDDEYSDSIAFRVKQRKSGEVKTVDERETESMLSVKPCDTFINKISNFIKASSPAFIFNPSKSRKRRRKMLTKMIHPELQCLWKHSSQLFTGQIIQSESSSPSVPKVDWEKVNKRFISNIPEPSAQPVYGCSPDPDFYEHGHVRRCQPSGAVTWEIKWSKHKSSKTPFGTKLGYLTNAGVISPDSNNSQVIHGYTWSPSCSQFVLHAVFQESVGPKKKKRKKMEPR